MRCLHCISVPPILKHPCPSSLCAVDLCDDAEVQETGYYTFKLHARKSSISLSAKSADEVNEWIAYLQDVIDSCPTIQTITERVILEIIVSNL